MITAPVCRGVRAAVSFAGAVLVAPAVRPVQPMGAVASGRRDDGVAKEPHQFPDSDRDQPGVQVGHLLAELVIFFNPSPGRCDGDQLGLRDRPGAASTSNRTTGRSSSAAGPAARCGRRRARRRGCRLWPQCALGTCPLMWLQLRV